MGAQRGDDVRVLRHRDDVWADLFHLAVEAPQPPRWQCGGQHLVLREEFADGVLSLAGRGVLHRCAVHHGVHPALHKVALVRLRVLRRVEVAVALGEVMLTVVQVAVERGTVDAAELARVLQRDELGAHEVAVDIEGVARGVARRLRQIEQARAAGVAPLLAT